MERNAIGSKNPIKLGLEKAIFKQSSSDKVMVRTKPSILVWLKVYGENSILHIIKML